MPLVTLLTPTRNKPHYLWEAYLSLRQQTMGQWEWWVVGNQPTPETLEVLCRLAGLRGVLVAVDNDSPPDCHVPADLVNRWNPRVQTPYLMFLADDDLLDPLALETLVGALETHPDWDLVHGKCEVWTEVDPKDYPKTLTSEWQTYIQHGNRLWISTSWVGGWEDLGLGTSLLPDCIIDGGQFLQTKRAWDRATADGWTLPTDLARGSHNDGLYMNRLAEFYTFHFLNQKVLTHRKTSLSSHGKPDWAIGGQR